jgi:hypothetical protein
MRLQLRSADPVVKWCGYQVEPNPAEMAAHGAEHIGSQLARPACRPECGGHQVDMVVTESSGDSVDVAPKRGGGIMNESSLSLEPRENTGDGRCTSCPGPRRAQSLRFLADFRSSAPLGEHWALSRLRKIAKRLLEGSPR